MRNFRKMKVWFITLERIQKKLWFCLGVWNELFSPRHVLSDRNLMLQKNRLFEHFSLKNFPIETYYLFSSEKVIYWITTVKNYSWRKFSKKSRSSINSNKIRTVEKLKSQWNRFRERKKSERTEQRCPLERIKKLEKVQQNKKYKVKIDKSLKRIKISRERSEPNKKIKIEEKRNVLKLFKALELKNL